MISGKLIEKIRRAVNTNATGTSVITAIPQSGKIVVG